MAARTSMPTSGEQVSAANVVIVFADHALTDIVESVFQGSVSYGLEIRLWFAGEAILLRDGRRFDGRWVRPTRESLLSLRTQDGGLMVFKPGSTWVQLVRPPEAMNPDNEWVRIDA